ncbi:MAG: hypothetical protein HC882_00430 [Acidobacteria bacterium]|nr:hypothetical protein [Acidobacteriota bacterium]
MHPCAKKTGKPSWCNKKKASGRKKTARKGKMTCSCPKGFERKGIMCKKGRTVKRATCRPKRR